MVLNGVTTLVKVAHVRLCHSRMPFGDTKMKGLTPAILVSRHRTGSLVSRHRTGSRRLPSAEHGRPTNRAKIYPSIRTPHLTSVPFHAFTKRYKREMYENCCRRCYRKCLLYPFRLLISCVPISGKVLKLEDLSSPEKFIPCTRTKLRGSSLPTLAIKAVSEIIISGFRVRCVKNLFMIITRKPTKD